MIELSGDHALLACGRDRCGWCGAVAHPASQPSLPERTAWLEHADIPTLEESQRNWRRLVREFDGESHRGAALVAAALLDLNLEDLLRAFLIDDPSEVEYLLGTGLQSFGARIRVCYALGLISDDESNDLRVIQSVRNYFAHNLHVTFEADSVKQQLRRLRLLHRVMPAARTSLAAAPARAGRLHAVGHAGAAAARGGCHPP